MQNKDINCETALGTTVSVRVRGGLGGDKQYAGGFISGFHGHEASLLSAEDMRNIAAALIAAAAEIEAAGLPNFANRNTRKG